MQENAVRLATVATDNGTVSYWQHGEEVYRLNEYEPVQFDIYGIPLGARWETNFFHWPQLKALFGLVESTELPDGTIETHEYDELGRLCAFTRE